MALTEFDWPAGTGGPGSGSVQSLIKIGQDLGLAWAVGNVIGVGLFFFGPGKFRALGGVILLIPGLDILLGTGAVVVLEETGLLTGQFVFGENIWTGPGVIYYV